MRVLYIAFLLVLFAMTIMSRLPAQAQTPAPAVRLSPAFQQRSLEDGTFTVSVRAENLEQDGSVLYDDNRDTVPDREVDSIGLGAFEFTIEYDPARVEVVNAAPGAVVDASDRAFMCLQRRDGPGEFSFGCASQGANPPGPHGTFALADVEFAPVAAGSVTLVLEGTELAGPLSNNISVQVEESGFVQLTGTMKDQPSPALDGTDGGSPGGSSEDTGQPSDAGNGPGPASQTPVSLFGGPGSPDGTPAAAAERLGGNLRVGSDPSEAPDASETSGAAGASSSGGGRVSWLAVAAGSIALLGALAVLVLGWRERHRFG